MTTRETPAHDEAPEEPPECAAIQDAAQQLMASMTARLRDFGFDFVLISVKRLVRKGGYAFVPGAAAYRMSDAVVPSLRQEAQHLRAIADELERAAIASGVDVLGGYVENVSEAPQ